MWNDKEIILNNFYSLKIEEDPKRAKKIAKIIEEMGDKYCLAIPVPRKNA
jgi:hypothetical protein